MNKVEVSHNRVGRTQKGRKGMAGGQSKAVWATRTELDSSLWLESPGAACPAGGHHGMGIYLKTRQERLLRATASLLPCPGSG